MNGAIYIDGLIYRLVPHGGIARYFGEVFSRLAVAHPDLELVFDVEVGATGHLPKAANILPVEEWMTLRRRLGRRLKAGCCKTVFQTTYYSFPHQRDVPYVVTAYDLIHATYPGWFRHGQRFVDAQRRSVAQADRVVAISRYTADKLTDQFGVDASKIEIASPGVSAVFREPIEETQIGYRDQLRTIVNGNRYLLYVGQRGGYKNFRVLLQAFAALGDRFDYHLVALGGEAQFTQAEIEFLIDHQLEQRVHLVPACPDAMLRAAYADTAALVYCSLDEGFGIPPLEAMASGTLVLASDIPPLREVCAEAPVYFDPRSRDALVGAIEQIDDAGLREACLRKGHERAAHYTWDDCAAVYARVYRELLGY